MPRDWGDVLGKALWRGPIGEGPRGGPRDGTLRVALGNAQGKAFGMALGMASGKAPGLALGVALRRAFGMALGMAQGAIRKALGIAVGRAIGKALWKALGMAPAKSHMHGPSASTAQPGTSKPSPKHNAAQGCGHATKRPAAGFRKPTNVLVFAYIGAYLAAPAVG